MCVCVCVCVCVCARARARERARMRAPYDNIDSPLPPPMRPSLATERCPLPASCFTGVRRCTYFSITFDCDCVYPFRSNEVLIVLRGKVCAQTKINEVAGEGCKVVSLPVRENCLPFCGKVSFSNHLVWYQFPSRVNF